MPYVFSPAHSLSLSPAPVPSISPPRCAQGGGTSTASAPLRAGLAPPFPAPARSVLASAFPLGHWDRLEALLHSQPQTVPALEALLGHPCRALVESFGLTPALPVEFRHGPPAPSEQEQAAAALFFGRTLPSIIACAVALRPHLPLPLQSVHESSTGRVPREAAAGILAHFFLDIWPAGIGEMGEEAEGSVALHTRITEEQQRSGEIGAPRLMPHARTFSALLSHSPRYAPHEVAKLHMYLRYFDRVAIAKDDPSHPDGIHFCSRGEGATAWMWEKSDDMWQPYHPDIVQQLNAAVAQGKKKAQVLIGVRSFIIDFENMAQKNGDTGVLRRIKQCSGGDAGLNDDLVLRRHALGQPRSMDAYVDEWKKSTAPMTIMVIDASPGQGIEHAPDDAVHADFANR